MRHRASPAASGSTLKAATPQNPPDGRQEIRKQVPAQHIPFISSSWNAGTFILLLVFAYFWIGISPITTADPAQAADAVVAPTSNLLNQLVVVSMAVIVMVRLWSSPARSRLLDPHGLLLLILTWFCLVSLLASSPETAFRRIVFAVLVCICANAVLLLPRNRREFTSVLAIVVTASLVLAYTLVLFMPVAGIHQSNETEAALAGSWRGHFGHKNAAAAAMAQAVFVGLYLRQISYRMLGTFIVVFAAIFLYFAGGKTSAGMLPAVLLTAWIFERVRWLRYPLILCSLIGLNFLLVGSSVSPPIAEWLASFGIDVTFTGRNTIWSFALNEISQQPLTGYGFQAFWQSPEMIRGSAETMTFRAAHSHNSYLEALINGGIPGLLLLIPWLILLPIRDAGRALAGSNDLALTRLFLRMWLFTIYVASLESVFFENSGPVWFTMLIGVFGLRLQARAQLSDVVRAPAPSASPKALAPARLAPR